MGLTLGHGVWQIDLTVSNLLARKWIIRSLFLGWGCGMLSFSERLVEPVSTITHHPFKIG